MSKSGEKRVRSLQQKLDKALKKGGSAAAVEILEELEGLEPKVARWPHKRGDMLRKLGRSQDAVRAYERAVAIYADCGFLARAIAMAKVLLEIDASRVDVLEKVDPQAARELHRRNRPNSVRIDVAVVNELGRRAEQLAPPQQVAAPREDAIAPARPSTIDLDLSDIELGQPVSMPPEPEPARARPLGAEGLSRLPLFPLFAEVPPAVLHTLARESDLVQLRDGDFVVRRGDPSDALFGIVSGRVRVIPAGAQPGEFVTLGEGEVFGEACLLSSERRTADVLVEGELVALRIAKQTLDGLVVACPAVAELLLELMARRLLANLFHTSRFLANLDTETRKQLARAFEIRRAPAGTVLAEPSRIADAVYIALTGHLEVTRSDTRQAGIVGAGVMFGQASVLSRKPSLLTVVTKENLLLLRLPAAAFSRIALGSNEILDRVASFGVVASIAS